MAQRRARVAVIGAGPAGLAVARELQKEGHCVTVFEAADGVGGAWRFDGATDSDLLGLNRSRARVHSSMYAGLRTNLPRAVMSLCDFPFSCEALGSRSHDPRQYPLHSEVLAFCEALADVAGLREHLVLNTRVLRVDPILPDSVPGSLPSATQPVFQAPFLKGAGSTESTVHAAVSTEQQGGTTEQPRCCAPSHLPQPLNQHTGLKWRVITDTHNSSSTAEASAAELSGDAVASPQEAVAAAGQPASKQQEWVFDAIAGCVGIFSEIQLPQVPGMAEWPGLQLHSHNYREPEQFRGQRVMVVGASFSGEEIARHIAKEAREVLHCARTFTGPGTARQQTAGQHVQQPQQPQQQQQPLQQQHNQCQHKQDQHIQCQQQRQQDQRQKQWQQQQQQGPIPQPYEPRANISRLPMLQELRPDGSAVLLDGQLLEGIDAIVYCTGYKYSFPWLEHLGLLQTDDACVRPLFAHMFIPSVGPSLSLCGLSWRSAKFPQFQLQGQLLARLLSGRAVLPPQHYMEKEQQALFEAMRAQGMPLRYTHCMASLMPEDEWAYAARLVASAGAAPQSHLLPCTTDSSDLGGCAACSHAVIQQDQHQKQGQDGSDDVSVHRSQQEQGAGAALQDSIQRQPKLQQQQQAQPPDLVEMPAWLKDLAVLTAGDIMRRPDTFRDEWTDDVEKAMAVADTAMHELYQAAAVNRRPC